METQCEKAQFLSSANQIFVLFDILFSRSNAPSYIQDIRLLRKNRLVPIYQSEWQRSTAVQYSLVQYEENYTRLRLSEQDLSSDKHTLLYSG